MNPQFRPLRSLALETERKLQTLRKTADAALKTVCGNRAVFPRAAEIKKLRHRIPLNVKRRIEIARNQWHNRITGENDVEVDVSAKFMPLPYFGFCAPVVRQFPQKTAGPGRYFT